MTYPQWFYPDSFLQIISCVTSFAGHRMHGLRQSFYHGLCLLGNNFREHLRMDDSHWFFCAGFFHAIFREAASPALFRNVGIHGIISRSLFRALLCSGLLRLLFRRGFFRARFFRALLRALLCRTILRLRYRRSFCGALLSKSFFPAPYVPKVFRYALSQRFSNGFFPACNLRANFRTNSFPGFLHGSFLCTSSREIFGAFFSGPSRVHLFAWTVSMGYFAGVFLVRSFVGPFYLALFWSGEFHELSRKAFILAVFCR